MKTARRVALETLGWVLVVTGIAALILPGPGLLLLFGGLAVLSQQYDWAERRLRPVEERAWRAAEQSVQSWPRIVASCAGALWVIGTGLVWTVRPDAPSWWPFAERFWLLGGWPTGVTLIASGLIALGLIGYSYKRFRNGKDERTSALAAQQD